MVTGRAGRGRLGCLFLLLLVAAGGYFGLDFGEAYVRYFRYRDAMAQAARFSSVQTDGAIRAHLANVADSLGLPPKARNVTIRRSGGVVTIEADYVETVQLPGNSRELHFTPSVQKK
jgi:hypothetical protein